MDKYKYIKKMVGSKSCPECGRTLDLDNNVAYCECGFESALEYKDKNRDKNRFTKGDYRRRSNQIRSESNEY